MFVDASSLRPCLDPLVGLAPDGVSFTADEHADQLRAIDAVVNGKAIYAAQLLVGESNIHLITTHFLLSSRLGPQKKDTIVLSIGM
jgi:hypothetical protein